MKNILRYASAARRSWDKEIMEKKLSILVIIGSLVLLLDQFTKIWVNHSIVEGQHISVISRYFDLVHYRNSGAAFGMFAGWLSPWREIFFYVISAVALIFLIYYFVKTPLSQKGILISLSMILSGALGNLIDRIFRGNVVDFLLFHWHDKVAHFSLFGKSYTMELVWPAFNVADSAISVGVVLLILGTMRMNKE